MDARTHDVGGTPHGRPGAVLYFFSDVVSDFKTMPWVLHCVLIPLKGCESPIIVTYLQCLLRDVKSRMEIMHLETSLVIVIVRGRSHDCVIMPNSVSSKDLWVLCSSPHHLSEAPLFSSGHQVWFSEWAKFLPPLGIWERRHNVFTLGGHLVLIFSKFVMCRLVSPLYHAHAQGL